MSDKVDIKSLNYDELTEYITSISRKEVQGFTVILMDA